MKTKNWAFALLGGLVMVMAMSISASAACPTVWGYSATPTMPHGEVKVRMTRNSDGFRVDADLNNVDGYYEITTTSAGQWTLTPYWEIEPGYPATPGYWRVEAGYPGHPSIFSNNSLPVSWDEGTCAGEPNYFPFEADVQFYPWGYGCEGQVIAGHLTGVTGSRTVVNLYRSNVYGNDINVSSEPLVAEIEVSPLGYWSYTIPDNTTRGGCGYFRAQPSTYNAGYFDPGWAPVHVYASGVALPYGNLEFTFHPN